MAEQRIAAFQRHHPPAVEASLSRLQTDRLDMYLIHEPNPDTPLDETLQALERHRYEWAK